MAGQRGSIRRRQPDPSRKPPKPPVVLDRGVPVYLEPQPVIVPAHGSVKLFELRLATEGVLRDASIKATGIPEGELPGWFIVLEGLEVARGRWKAEPTLSIPSRLRVGPDEVVSIHIERRNQSDEIEISVDLSYMFQELKRAAIPNKSR